MAGELAVVLAVERQTVAVPLWEDLRREARTMPFELLWIHVGARAPVPWAGTAVPAGITVREVVETPRLGCPEGLSRGAEQTDAPWVLLLSDDMRIVPGSLRTGLDWMQAHPAIGVGMCYMNERGSPCQACEDVAQVPMFTRAMGNRIGWLRCEGAYRHYCVDAETPYRVLEAGGLVARIPNCCFQHLYVEDAARTSRRQPLDDDYRTFLSRWSPEKRATWRARLEVGLREGGPTLCLRHALAPCPLEEDVDPAEAESKRALWQALHEHDQAAGGCPETCEICGDA